MSFAYYNDKFNLNEGDLVYVDGKLEGKQGVVVSVSRSFKIKLSDYKRVIAVIDKSIDGDVYLADSHFICFDRDALAYEKIRSWVMPPLNEDDAEYAVGRDDEQYSLDNIGDLPTEKDIIERGVEYYKDNRIVYICADGGECRAIVRGSAGYYEVEFDYRDRMVSNLTCDCYCSGICKHIVAVCIQFKDLLDTINADYSQMYEESGYFAAVDRALLLEVGTACKKRGKLSLKI